MREAAGRAQRFPCRKGMHEARPLDIVVEYLLYMPLIVMAIDDFPGSSVARPQATYL